MFEEGSTVYWVIVASFVMPILLSIGLVWFFITFQKRKHQHQMEMKDAALRQQDLIIQKQQALQAERTRIAGEMHDDLGGGLTSIKFLSQKLLRKIKDDSLKPQLHKVIDHSTDLVSNMSEIIWAMNAGFDTLDNLIAFSRRNAREYLDTHEIKLHFEVVGDSQGINLSGEKRRNLYLIIKEALHNAVKHAEASHFNIKYEIADQIVITLQDNGKGLPEDVDINGNGLRNMQNRIASIGGSLSTKSYSSGLTLVLNLPITE